MFYYSKNSRRKVVHTSRCFWMDRISPERLGAFSTLDEARRQGYRLCRCCDLVGRMYRAESPRLDAYCQEMGMSIRCCPGCVQVVAPHSLWKIILSEDGGAVQLYHGNTYNKGETGPCPGYHQQKVKRGSLAGYLEYIGQHEDYRRRHPLPPAKGTPAPPPKGSKNYRKLQKKRQKREKRRAADRVLWLIGQLAAQGEAVPTQ